MGGLDSSSIASYLGTINIIPVFNNIRMLVDHVLDLHPPRIDYIIFLSFNRSTTCRRPRHSLSARLHGFRDHSFWSRSGMFRPPYMTVSKRGTCSLKFCRGLTAGLCIFSVDTWRLLRTWSMKKTRMSVLLTDTTRVSITHTVHSYRTSIQFHLLCADQMKTRLSSVKPREIDLSYSSIYLS